jgi:hypothetical protein
MARAAMEIRWRDIGYTEEPGDYSFRGIIVQVDARQIAIWKEHPGAIFTLRSTDPVAAPNRYVLASYRLE